ncbi:hypothetical protein CBL_07680 [Carabus blaptoides fortunei]
MAYFRYRNRNTNNRSGRVRFNQPFSFKKREKVEVKNKLPLNIIVSETASRDQVRQYSTLKECLDNSRTTSTRTDPVQQDVLNNYSPTTEYAETMNNRGTAMDPNITFNYRDDINYDLNSTASSESWPKDKSLFSRDHCSTDNDVCPKYPDKRTNLQKIESDILKNIKSKKYVPRVQPFLAVFSPKKKRNTSLLQSNNRANKVTDVYSVKPYFQWSKNGQKRRYESANTDPLYKVLKEADSSSELSNSSFAREHNLNNLAINMDFTWKPQMMTQENNEEPADITFLYKSFTRLPYTSNTNVSFQFEPNIDEELKE